MITVNHRHELPWHSGMTVREMLQAMKYTYNDIVVRVDGRVVLDEEYDTAEIPDGADVRVIHLIAGG